MSPIKDCLVNKNSKVNPVWIMRQAGRYLPEFREIRKRNQNFIELCLNSNLSSEITLQPLKRFDLDAAIIFSDILMLPFGLGQKVEFKKDFGPLLGDFDFNNIDNLNEANFTNKLSPIYNMLNNLKSNVILKNKDLFGFVGAPWTLLIYMLNKQSPKKKIENKNFKDVSIVDSLLKIIDKFLKVHIRNQVSNGASVIQIFDSWAGLVEENDLDKLIYKPTKSLVDFTKLLGVPVICFPRNIKNYKEYVNFVNPDGINIDYEVNPELIAKDINITIQGGIKPDMLLKEKSVLEKEILKYHEIFKNHSYIFNLGHGILPETDPNTVKFFVERIKEL